ncbi:branched-chain amino acid ABC transporter ATP-binding protein/permease [Pseudomonas sp. LRF_L74]|uniref:branched-chain amino acid ABC transporter ATP-binding protein/permease n=1 Tax=Pseudomonas sp. LRF_L74 TaxID=3369422 RepID=UPI003F5E2467
MANVLKRYGLGGDLLLIALALICPWVAPYYAFLFTSVIITALLCLSIGVTTERAGIISLCQVGISGVGAWVAMWISVHLPQTPVLLTLLLGGLAASLVGLLIVLPTLRVRGINLAIITLAFALAINIVLTRVEFPGALEGDSFERPDWIGTDTRLLWFAIALAIAIGRLVVWIEQRPLGAGWFAARYSERAAASLGINVAVGKLLAFMLGGFIAGVSGVLLVLQLGSVTSNNFEPIASLILFALAILARSRFLSGALVAGLLTWFTPQALTALGLGEWKDIANLIFAIGAIYALSGHGKGLFPRSDLQPGSVARGEPLQADQTQATSKAASLDLNAVTLKYGAVVALDNVSFSLKPGKVTGLVGPNGAGKSSLVDVISGFAPIQGGQILLGGHEIGALSASARARRGLRRTFQQGRAVPELTIRQYVRLASLGQYDAALLDSILMTLSCPPADAYIGLLDVGTRRLVEIAAALMSRPGLLLLDEPAAGMSALESDNLAEVIRRLPELFGCTVLLIEHDIALIRSVCSELIVLEFGKVLARGAVDTTLADPRVVEAYLGAA